MAMAICSLHFISSSIPPRLEARAGNSRVLNLSLGSKAQNDGHGRRVWRRRKLTKKDDMLRYKMERVPFLEEQVRKIKETGKLMTMDIERLLLSEDNRFDFVNEVAAEAKEYVERNRDEYGGSKKAILHVLSNRVNDAGFYRSDAYAEADPFKPGPTFLKEEFTSVAVTSVRNQFQQHGDILYSREVLLTYEWHIICMRTDVHKLMSALSLHI